MGAHRPPRRLQVGSRPLSSAVQGLFSFEEHPAEPALPGAADGESSAGAGGSEAADDRGAGLDDAGEDAPLLVVRVLPDVVRLDKPFDYAVPAAWHADGRVERLAVGSIVRFRLGGRRLRGWVDEIGVDPAEGVELQPLLQLTGMGPPADVVGLARWAAWRWAGRTVHLLRAASPPRVVTRPAATSRGSVAAIDQRQPQHPAQGREGAGASGDGAPLAGTDTATPANGLPAGDLFGESVAVRVLRCPPADDWLELARSAARCGDALIVAPGLADARRIALDLRRRGVRVALGPDDWAVAAAGATVVGTRTAVWMPMPRLASVLVLDEHAQSLQSEQAPTWHARDVAIERARRAGAPAVLASPVPTVEALDAGELRTVGRAAEREGWPTVDVLDRRLEDPSRGGLFAEGLRDRVAGTQGTVAVVLNRKGRARLLACRACGELARSADGRVSMRLIDDELVAADGSERRPVVCAECGSTVLRNLRMGVTRAREELSALVGEPVGEVTAEAQTLGRERIVIGTEAVLWRLGSARAVVFLDFDQELLAPRQRAAEQALALLARAARLTGGRRGGGRLLVQTRQSEHPVVQAAVRADPSIVASVEIERRRTLGLPPFGAQARVSGAGADAFVASLRAVADAAVSVRGPRDGEYLLRSPAYDPLLDSLARTPRPAKRARVEVDPLRV